MFEVRTPVDDNFLYVVSSEKIEEFDSLQDRHQRIEMASIVLYNIGSSGVIKNRWAR